MGRVSILVNPQSLKARIDSNRAPVILDVRWYRNQAGGYEHYLEKHVLNAIYVDMEQDLTAINNPSKGRRPFPRGVKVQELTRKWGIDKNSYVVVYDTVGGTSAARAWWILRNAGVNNVCFLDGGLQRWEREGMPTMTGPGIIPLRGNFEVADKPCMPTIGVEEARDWPQHGILLDVRSARRYRGHFEYNDARLGHIPGAYNLPTYGNIGPDHKFLDAESLRERFADLGITKGSDVAVYCGSGNLSTHTIAALEVAGLYGASLYAGGWSQWCLDPERPAARGVRP